MAGEADLELLTLLVELDKLSELSADEERSSSLAEMRSSLFSLEVGEWTEDEVEACTE